MTTPAINATTNQTTIATAWATGQDPCTGPFSQISSVSKIYRQVVEVRPASVNNPKNHRTGWRNPSAWSHSKLVHNPNPLCTVTTCATSGGSCYCPNKREYRDGEAWDNTGLSSVAAFPAYLSQVARSRALLQLKQNRPNLAVIFAERKQTESLFVDTFKRIAEQVNTFRNHRAKDWGQVKASVKRNLHRKNGYQAYKLPKAYLEMMYGWRPMMSDVYSSCNALSKREAAAQIYKFRVMGTSRQRDVTFSNKYSSHTHGYYFAKVDENIHNCRVVLYYRLNNGLLASFASLGVTNPLEAIWEKIPYSFALDWALPVGNWLSTLDADLGWIFDSGTETRMTRMSSNSSFRTDAAVLASIGINASKVGFHGDTYKARGFNMTRSLFATSPWAGFPSFKNPLSSTHIAEAMSLLAGAFRR